VYVTTLFFFAILLYRGCTNFPLKSFLLSKVPLFLSAYPPPFVFFLFLSYKPGTPEAFPQSPLGRSSLPIMFAASMRSRSTPAFLENGGEHHLFSYRRWPFFLGSFSSSLSSLPLQMISTSPLPSENGMDLRMASLSCLLFFFFFPPVGGFKRLSTPSACEFFYFSFVDRMIFTSLTPPPPPPRYRSIH